MKWNRESFSALNLFLALAIYYISACPKPDGNRINGCLPWIIFGIEFTLKYSKLFSLFSKSIYSLNFILVMFVIIDCFVLFSLSDVMNCWILEELLKNEKNFIKNSFTSFSFRHSSFEWDFIQWNKMWYKMNIIASLIN